MNTGTIGSAPSEETAHSSGNVVQLRHYEQLEDFTLPTNVVELHKAASLNLVELDNIVELTSAESDSEELSECANGVCSVSWKPNRPTAA
jgi:hypothetical protein